jgi:putative flavoprotein involved in K+ transport
MADEGALVIGAGAAGLATAAMLKQAGVKPAVLERSDRIGSSWLSCYDGLRLNTLRRMSDLPGFPCDPYYGAFPTARDWASYLERYAAHHGLDVRLGVEVKRIDSGPLEWIVRTGDGELRAPAVVVATGFDHEPMIPSWPGRHGFTGELIHTAEYRNPKPYEGRRVLVVGAGNSGAEVATEIAECAAKVWLSVRTPPTMFPRRFLGLPTNPLGVVLDMLPTPLADRAGFIGQRIMIGDLSKYGLPQAPDGVKTRLRRDKIGPCVQDHFASALKRGSIEIVPALRSFDGAEVDVGRRIRPDAVIAATGYGRGLEPLVGHLGLLRDDGIPRAHGERTDPAAPGIYFVGFDALCSGQLRLMARDGRAVAKRIAYGRRSMPAFGRASSIRLPGTPRTRPA